MIATEPIVNPMGRYSIRETHEALGIDRKTLRKYTKLGLIKSNVRRTTKREFYSGKDILLFWRATYF